MTQGSPPEFGWTWMRRSILLRRRQTLVLLAVVGGLYAVGLVFPIATQKAIDRIVTGRIESFLIVLAILVVLAVLAEAALLRARQWVVTDLATFIDRRIARMAFAHLMRVRVDVAGFRGGEILNHFQQARKIQSFVLTDLPQAGFELGNFIASLVVIFFYDRWVGIALVIASPLILLAVRAPLEGTKRASLASYEAIGAQQNILSETVNAVTTVKSLGFEALRFRLWKEATDVMLGKLRALMREQNRYMISTQGTSRLLNLMVVVIGGVQLIHHDITVGDLFALQVLGARITAPIIFSSNVYNRYQEVDVAIRQMASFLTSDRERARRKPPLRRFDAGGIALRNVSLTYPKAMRPALSGVDLDLPERGVVAIVGRNGSGKSTLIRILLGLNRDYTGTVAFFGHDLADYDPRWLRSHVGAVDQETVLFSGTIRQNLSGGRPISEDALRDALAFADVLDLVDAMPDGLDTVLTENARTLSGGQRQRLSIARAIARQPRIVLFDEAMAFLDAEAAVKLERRLTQLGRDRLVILVTHHLAATRDVARILVLEDGRLVGDGQHLLLLETTPTYATLWADYTRKLGDA